MLVRAGLVVAALLGVVAAIITRNKTIGKGGENRSSFLWNGINGM
jgi:hypothetical protein